MKLNLRYEYGRRINANVKILAVVAIAVSGIVLSLEADCNRDKPTETEVIPDNPTD